MLRRVAVSLTALSLVVLALPCACQNTGSSDQYPATRYIRTTTLGIPVNVIYINLNNPSVRLTAAIAQGGIGANESFTSFMHRLQPDAAINGTFFSKSNWRPIGDIVINGRLEHFGGMGTGLCLTEDNKACFVTVPWGRNVSWDGYKTVICCGPRLVTDGQASVNASGEGFRDPHVLGRGLRTAVGLTYRNRLILLNTRKACSLSELAGIMKALGCTNAINFDGGASTAMYYKGRVITTAGRKLTNVLLVYE